MTDTTPETEAWSYGIGTWTTDDVTGGLIVEMPSWRGWVGTENNGGPAETATLRLLLTVAQFDLADHVFHEPPPEEPDPEEPPVEEPPVEPGPPVEPTSGTPGNGAPEKGPK